MTQIKVDNIADAAGTGAPDFEDGLTVAGSAISTLNTAEYYESGTEPSSPKNGALWKDTANDKLMMYVAGEFKEIELGASSGPVQWTVDLSNVTYDSISFSTAGQDTNSNTFGFNLDGTKMYATGNVNDSVYQYTLSTAFDVSTASYDSVSFSLSGLHPVPYDGAFSADGTKMYTVGTSSDAVRQHSLSTAFDLSTASYDNVSLSVASQDGSPLGVSFNADGTKMYIAGASTDSIYQYSLSTAFDLSTASYDNVSLSIASQDTTPFSAVFNTDGTKMYVSGGANDSIYQYSLTTGFDISTASYDNVSVSVASQSSAPSGVIFSADGTKMYVAEYGAVYQYSTGL